MKTFARKIYMFNNFLRLAEIKAVLEGRGFRPNFLVNTLSQLSPFPNSQDSLGYLLSSVSRGRIEIARRVDRACLKRLHYFLKPF
jgi:hypothetical protein